MQALTTKLFREVGHLRGQLIAIVVVIACGIANFVTFRAVHSSLTLTQKTFYENSRFADLFLSARRVPESVSDRIRSVGGVAIVETRVVTEVLLDLPGVPEAASGTILSVPDAGQPLLNRLYLRNGRWLSQRAENEVIVSTAFADANGYIEGDQFSAVINGRKRKLTIVGRAISPEYVIELSPGTFTIDNKRYGIMWMSRSALAAAFDMQGAFNSATVQLERGADERTIKDKIDLILKPYGSIGSIGRDEQTSNRFLTDEITQVQVQAVLIPTIFLGVAIFLLNIALLRLVSTQRMSIAILKAFGYSNVQIGFHYIGFALLATVLGSILGYFGGSWLGVALTELYAKFYRFPTLRFDVPEGVIVGSVLLAVGASVLGAWGAVRTVVALPPAEAMRPEAPRSFKPGILERIPLLRRLDPVMHMIWRTLERRPLKAVLSVAMISLAVAILIIGRSMFDMFDVIMERQFNQAYRLDAMVTFVQPRSSDAVFDAQHLPGVMYVEAFRSVPVDLISGRYTKRMAIQSVSDGQQLSRIINMDGSAAKVPPDGLVLSEYLADLYGIEIGDSVTIQLLTEDRRSLRVPLSGLNTEMFGVQAYMNDKALARLLDEQGSVSGIYTLLDPDQREAFSAAIKDVPMAAGVLLRQTMFDSFDDNYKENMDISTIYIVAFAMIIAFGVVYNCSRIALSERATELASLRILGFTIREIAVILLGEQAIIILMAFPVGIALGGWVVSLLPDAFTTDLFRFPVVLTLKNLGLAVATISVVAVATGALIYRKLNRLDLIAVLKSRE